MDEIIHLAEVGDVRGAVEKAGEIGDPVKRLKALVAVIEISRREDVLPPMLDALDEITSTPEKIVAMSFLGRALYLLDRDRDAEKAFESAVQMAESLRSPRVKAEVFAAIARNLALSDRYSDSYEYFRLAVEQLQFSRALYSEIISALIKIARLIEKTGDETPTERALDFYRLARELYASIRFTLQVEVLEEKMELVEDVLKRKSAAIVDLINMGDIERAMKMTRFLPPREKAFSLLEISYWLFLHDYRRLGRSVLEDALNTILVGKFKPDDSELESVGRRFLRIGLLEEALTITGIIQDEKRASGLLGDIAISYARRGEINRALSIAEGIQDEETRISVLEELKSGET
ncbi:tetratricopeptide repeat protein [Thermococcus sp.]